MPEVLQDVRKRDNKARIFARSDDDDDEMKKLTEITKAKLKLGRLEMTVSIKRIEKSFDKKKA